MGCSSGAGLEILVSLADRVLSNAALGRPDVIATIATKQADPVWFAIAQYYGCELCFFDAKRLEQETPRLLNPSQAVFDLVGCYGVAESAALAAAGDNSVLLVEKIAVREATAALAVAGFD
ncbi:cobalamin biosynthesis protein [Brucella gallinifaecis]|uniref:Cobalamin biosynthesis protein n=1 Tax=Brucella gallinifaecis TaxID=215590 RepID=A0A502BQ27_9HYPH|nr:cobalamin biosynthesis protein [Brucella gallinifaecis]TPF75937.1 cobalamin biosynthesis protein [Brucella gallinifaecis]